ncbi:MAG: diguanylate cyclase domain-containing protein, partial [Janthinobacterium lividum]
MEADFSDTLRVQRQHRLWRTAIDYVTRPMAILDDQRRILKANRAFNDLFGYGADAVGTEYPDSFLVSPGLPASELVRARYEPREARHDDQELMLRTRHGEDIWVRLSICSILHEEANAVGARGNWIVALTDITEDKLLRALRLDVQNALMSELSFLDLGDYLCRRVRQIVPEVTPSILLVDQQLKLRLWAVSLLPAEFAESADGLLVGEGMANCGTAVARGERVISNDIEQDPLWAPFKELVLPHGFRACWSYPIRRRDGSVAGSFAFYATQPGGPSGFHERIVETCIDLCALAIEREESRQQITLLREYDALTGLPGHRALRLYAEELLNSANPYEIAFFCIDLDRFKDVNDTLGHVVGDHVLQVIGERLRAKLQAREFLARSQGDQFTLIAPGHDFNRTKLRADLLRELISEPIDVNGQQFHLSASIGISLYPHTGLEPDLLLRRANAAMHWAKSAGGGTFQFFSSEMNRAAGDRLLLGAALKRAVSNNELRLFYQPQICMDSNALYGVEALARWLVPGQGEVPAAKFIGLAEEIGQIEAIGRWALREACRQMAE